MSFHLTCINLAGEADRGILYAVPDFLPPLLRIHGAGFPRRNIEKFVVEISDAVDLAAPLNGGVGATCVPTGGRDLADGVNAIFEVGPELPRFVCVRKAAGHAHNGRGGRDPFAFKALFFPNAFVRLSHKSPRFFGTMRQAATIKRAAPASM